MKKQNTTKIFNSTNTSIFSTECTTRTDETMMRIGYIYVRIYTKCTSLPSRYYQISVFHSRVVGIGIWIGRYSYVLTAAEGGLSPNPNTMKFQLFKYYFGILAIITTRKGVIGRQVMRRDDPRLIGSLGKKEYLLSIIMRSADKF